MACVYAFVELVEPANVGGVFQWRVLDCPRCHATHSHGAGSAKEKVSQYLGHKIAHCDNTIGGYCLTTEERNGEAHDH